MPPADPLAEPFGPRQFASAFGVSRETTERLEIYADRLRFWQKTINLVAPGTVNILWKRHFADSAQLAALVPRMARTLVDVGSGGGFPGLVLAILFAEHGPCQRVVLIESDTRKAAFLADVVRRTGIRAAIAVDIVTERVEAAATRDKVGATDVVTARALAPMAQLIKWVAPLFGPDTVGLFLKGREVETELVGAARNVQMTYELVPSRTDPQGRIVVVRRLAVEPEG